MQAHTVFFVFMFVIFKVRSNEADHISVCAVCSKHVTIWLCNGNRCNIPFEKNKCTRAGKKKEKKGVEMENICVVKGWSAYSDIEGGVGAHQITWQVHKVQIGGLCTRKRQRSIAWCRRLSRLFFCLLNTKHCTLLLRTASIKVDDLDIARAKSTPQIAFFHVGFWWLAKRWWLAERRSATYMCYWICYD